MYTSSCDCIVIRILEVMVLRYRGLSFWSSVGFMHVRGSSTSGKDLWNCRYQFCKHLVYPYKCSKVRNPSSPTLSRQKQELDWFLVLMILNTSNCVIINPTSLISESVVRLHKSLLHNIWFYPYHNLYAATQAQHLKTSCILISTKNTIAYDTKHSYPSTSPPYFIIPPRL